MAMDFRVSLRPQEAANIIEDAIVEGSITGERIDRHTIAGREGGRCIVSVYEKHYYRVGNRLTVTVVIDDMEGATRVHAASGGGGDGLFRFDWGASAGFEECVAEAMAPYRI